jgi:hypothetical protein
MPRRPTFARLTLIDLLGNIVASLEFPTLPDRLGGGSRYCIKPVRGTIVLCRPVKRQRNVA